MRGPKRAATFVIPLDIWLVIAREQARLVVPRNAIIVGRSVISLAIVLMREATVVVAAVVIVAVAAVVTVVVVVVVTATVVVIVAVAVIVAVEAVAVVVVENRR